ncbi:hypothetical protein LC609_25955 [Nostoc sp. XA013]|nr:hypothetical protein [Nostoc sp. XA013]
MSTIEEGGYFTSDKEVKTYVEKYNNEYPNKDLMSNNFNEASKLIIGSNLPPDSLWIKKSSLFTLIVELIKIKNKYGYLPKEQALAHALKSLEEELHINKKEDVSKNMFAQYYYYTHQGTASRKGRNVRGQVISKILEESMNVN